MQESFILSFLFFNFFFFFFCFPEVEMLRDVKNKDIFQSESFVMF